jgi:hypothetical protein
MKQCRVKYLKFKKIPIVKTIISHCPLKKGGLKLDVVTDYIVDGLEGEFFQNKWMPLWYAKKVCFLFIYFFFARQ